MKLDLTWLGASTERGAQVVKPGSEPKGVRQAALLLHGMAPTDRTWVLDQLPQAQQELLSSLLAELAELGIPADPYFVREAVVAPTSPTAKPLHHLETWQLRVVADVVRHEPPTLVARLLVADSWPWSAQLLAGMDSARRRQIEVCIRALEAVPAKPLGDVAVVGSGDAPDGEYLALALVDAVTCAIAASSPASA